MKLSFVLCIVTMLQAFATGYSQTAKVSLSMHDVRIEEVLDKIEEQSEFYFLYNQKLVDLTKKVSIDVSGKTINEVLSTLFDKEKVNYIVYDRQIIVSPADMLDAAELEMAVLHQGIAVSGTITDESGEPMPGVNVRVKGTMIGTASDSNGRYSINVPNQEAVLVYSFIGYAATELVVGTQVKIDVPLKEDTRQIEEVVVVGYGVQKKVNLTGAVSVVDSKRLEDRPVANAVAALQGVSPGLVITRTSGQPGKEDYKAQIRGITSVNGADVLVLIDGVPGSMSLLNPDDIETVSILKDGAASAIYGARAAGGVLLVTTKKGRVQRATVEYSGLYSVDKLHGIPGRLHSWEDGDMENQARQANGGARLWSDEQLGWMKDPNFNFRVSPTNSKDYEYYYDMNYINELINKTSYNQSHSLSVTGGTEKSQYRFSVGYYGKNGILKYGPDGYDRFNIRANYKVDFTDKISLDSRLGFTKANTLSPVRDTDGDYGMIYTIYMLRSVYPFYVPNPDGTFTNHYARGTIGSMNKIMGELKEGGKVEEDNYNLDAVFTLSYAPVKGLNLRAIYSPQYNNYVYLKEFNPIIRWGISEPLDAAEDNYVTKKRRYIFQNNLQLLADYDLTLAEKHNFHLLGGYTFEDYRYDEIEATANALSSTTVFSLNLGDAAKNVAKDDIRTWAIMSYIGRFNYAYDGKYLFEASIRYDGSSRLAPDNRWHAFPSFSAGWNIAREDWFKAWTGLFDELKPRASWGSLGNSSVLGYYDYISLITKGDNYPFNNAKAASYYQKDLASDKKTWEVVQTTDIGLDIAMLKRRLTLSAGYFWKSTKDMLMPMTAPATFGVGLGNYNLADMKTWGWEVEGRWTDRIINDKLGYHFSFNVSDNDNEITRYGGKQIVNAGLNGLDKDGKPKNIIEGMPLNSIYGFVSEGLFQNQPEIDNAPKHTTTDANPSPTKPGDIRYRDIDKSGDITIGKGSVEDHGDLVYLGNTNPRYNFGFEFGGDFMGFDLSVFFQGVGQRKMYIDAMYAMPFYESWRQPWDVHADYWREDNPGAKFPRLYLGNQNRAISSYWVQDASYIRLKNLQVGYTIPQHLTRKIKVDKVRVYFSGQDLWESTGMWMPYYDPEAPQSATINYPLYRSFAFGLNVTF